MADEQTVWTFVAIDEVTPVLDEIEASVSGLGESIDAASASIAETSAAMAESMQAAGEAIAAVGESASAVAPEVSAMSDAMATIAASVSEGAASLGEVASSMAETGAAANDLSISLATIPSQVDAGDEAILATIPVLAEQATAMQEVATAAQEMAVAEREGATASSEVAASSEGMFAGLEGATNKLMMVGVVAALAGGAFLKMGMDGQKGEALLRGMAGASQSDINQLQVAAQQLGVGMKEAAAGFYQVESAGYSGSQAITVFTAAMKLAEGGQADAGQVMSGLTAIMHDYGAGADQAGHYTDLMAEAVFRGKQSMQDFSSAIGPLASAGENVGISFAQVAAAEATMTQVNPHVRQDAQQLTTLFNTLSPTMGTVAKSAKALGLSFNETHYASLDLLGKLQYLAEIAGGTNTAAFVKLTGGVRGSTAAIDLLKDHAGAFISNLQAMGHATGATENAFQQWENTIPGAMAHVGSSLSIFATKFLDAVGPHVVPLITGLSTQIGAMSTFIIGHLNQLMPVFAGLALFVGTILVGAFTAWAVSVIAATWPLLLIAGAIAAVGVGVGLLVQHWNDSTPVMNTVRTVLTAIGQFLIATFKPVWEELVSLWQSQIVPAWNHMMAALQPAMPALKLIGEIILGVVVVAFIALAESLKITLQVTIFVVVAIIKGVIDMATMILQALGWIVGAVNWVIGAWHTLANGTTSTVGGIGPFFANLWNGIASTAKAVWNGILAFFRGVWNGIQALFWAGVALVVGAFEWLYNHNYYFKDLVDMIVKVFTVVKDWLTNTWNSIVTWIVGRWDYLKNMVTVYWMYYYTIISAKIDQVETYLHTILTRITDFFKKIWDDDVAYLTKIWQQISGLFSSAWNTYIAGPIGNLWNQFVAWFNNLGKNANQWAINMMQQFINGILSMIGAVGNAVQQVAQQIAALLGFHSPPEEGILSDADQWMPRFITMLSTGLEQGSTNLLSSAQKVAQTLATANPTVSVAGSTGYTGSNSSIQLQILAELQTLNQTMKNQAAGSSNVQQYIGPNTFSSVTNAQQLYNLLNQIAGNSFEGGLRGATAGLALQ